ncbi:hypothetical protein MPNT_550004 [Candidatus Methylacidithermus pantelleriae]|uniref:Uncharacterized protein n=1 Tax=Candidatus Methylacidithermus pantelleriae TaxID=2744239 RepID=A0A8J2BS21_9BACT|nr:hypothetical protein MPNT_550004 [Candidatus Methylacidithermus pantelleriae]
MREKASATVLVVLCGVGEKGSEEDELCRAMDG